MKAHRNVRFKQLHDRDSAATFCDLELTNCTFDNCILSLTTDPARRTVVRNVRATDCEVISGSIGPAIFDNVEINALRTGDIALLWGPLFRHVTLRGKIGPLKINAVSNIIDVSPAAQEPFDRDREQFYAGIDWALDIREAEFLEFNLSGVPSALVRRDPASQVVVTRARASKAGWRKKVTKAAKYWVVVIDVFLGGDEPELILAAPKGRPKVIKELLEGLDELRRAGVTEPEGIQVEAGPSLATKKKPAAKRQ